MSMLQGHRVTLAPHRSGQLCLLNLISSHRMAMCSLFRSARLCLLNLIRSHGGSKARPKTFTVTGRPLVTTTRALSKHGCPLLSLLCSPTFRSTPMRAIRAWAGSLILLAKFDSDSANSHSQDEGEVGRKRSMWFKTRRNHATTATRSRQAMGKRPRTMT